MTQSLFDLLPKELEDRIYLMKHKLELEESLKEIRLNQNKDENKSWIKGYLNKIEKIYGKNSAPVTHFHPYSIWYFYNYNTNEPWREYYERWCKNNDVRSYNDTCYIYEMRWNSFQNRYEKDGGSHLIINSILLQSIYNQRKEYLILQGEDNGVKIKKSWLKQKLIETLLKIKSEELDNEVKTRIDNLGNFYHGVPWEEYFKSLSN